VIIDLICAVFAMIAAKLVYAVTGILLSKVALAGVVASV
jgi:hypothetical protein